MVLDGATLNPARRGPDGAVDTRGDNPWDEVAALGDFEVFERTPPELLLERARGAAVLLTNKTRLDAQAIARLPDLRLIAVTATGTDVVDVAAAAAHGVAVCNVPEYATDSVAQHVFALLLEVTNAVGEHARQVEQESWQRSEDFCFWTTPLALLAGKTMGIVGYGRIGGRVGEIAHAFGMRVLASGESRRRAGSPPYVEWVDLERVFAQADVVSLHCPLTVATTGFVADRLLGSMKEGSVLINTARGGLIDEEALVRALEAGRPAAAAVDVLSVEPPRQGNPLIASPRALVTPHLAWSTLDARRCLMRESAANVAAFLAGTPRNLVAPAGAVEARGTAKRPRRRDERS